jgi:hypothetical protein
MRKTWDSKIVEELRNKALLHKEDIVLTKAEHDDTVCKIKHHVSQLDKQVNGSQELYTKKRSATKASDDILLGKYGEYLVSHWLHNGNGKLPFLEPDMKVYAASKKTWEPDLRFSSMDKRLPDFAVKTCSPIAAKLTRKEKNDDYSWTFQNSNSSGNGGTDKLVWDKTNEVIVVFVYADTKNRGGTIVASSPWRKVSCLLGEPIIEKYKGIKKCIYYSDLETVARGELRRLKQQRKE